MFMAGQGRQDRHSVARPVSGGKPDRVDTLKRRYDFHLGEAIRAGLQGSHDKAAGHSGRALLISRKLCADAADPGLHVPERVLGGLAVFSRGDDAPCPPQVSRGDDPPCPPQVSRGDDSPYPPQAAPEPGWLVGAPRYLQLAAPDWAAAAVRAMTLHA